MKKVYMYAVYERFWHWLQTFAIVLLLFTGLIIHRPDIFGIFSFRVRGADPQCSGCPAGDQCCSVAVLPPGERRNPPVHPAAVRFLRPGHRTGQVLPAGIFKGEEHPFEKIPEKKLNPLQQITYFGILNVLLPLQIITGALMWGVQQWPQIAGWFGGLPFLAPFHSLVAWTFAAFIVGHVYLTTTGPEPLTSIQAMMNGWEDVEVHGEPIARGENLCGRNA